MHAATVDLMMKKASFESDTAMAVAEAFDIAIQHAQLVTVPMLDVRLGEFRSNVDARFVEFEAKMDARCAQIETNMVAQFATAKAEHDSLVAKMEARFALQDASID